MSIAPVPTPMAASEEFQLPPLPEIPSRVKLDASVREAFEKTCAELIETINGERRRQAAQHKWQSFGLEKVNREQIATATQFLEEGRGHGHKSAPLLNKLQYGRWATPEQSSILRKFIEHPLLPPVAFARFLVVLGFCAKQRGAHWQFTDGIDSLVRAYWKTHDVGCPLGLRELAAIFIAAGIPDVAIGKARLLIWSSWAAFLWDSETSWPYFAERQDLLAQALDLKAPDPEFREESWRYHRPVRRQLAYDLLAMFPHLPARFVEPCWEAALSAGKAERVWAQRALARVPDKLERLLAFLQSNKQDVRWAAAEWLGRLGDSQAIQPLKSALAKEKKDPVKGAMMGALELLHVSIDEFLNQGGLLAEAEKGLATGIPESLVPFPFEQMPAVHWQDMGKRIPNEVVKWWIVQSHKLKVPEPSALLRRLVALIRSNEAAELGLFVLSGWMGLSSAPANKGILAIVGAGGDRRCAIMAGDFIKRWYGYRSSECRALLSMLTWIDHPTAIQLLLSTARRFRTAGIRKEAERCVKLLAERRDWTISELADRSVSTCGLDDDDRLTLDYGPRQFFARINDDLAYSLVNADGEAITSLPEARKDEDAEHVKKIKKQYADAKKELKTVVKQQTERLYEAMCEQREWAFSDWDSYLRRHPIVRRLCQQIVWAEVIDSKTARTFRPLADESLTDATDTAIVCKADTKIRVAHDCLLEPEVVEQWKTHLADYEVAPLFEQLGKPVFTLAEEAREQTELRDFQGHLLEAFKLRNRATKFGYSRDSSEDGGWFYRYRKTLAGLSLEARIEFSGNSLPEENRTVALTTLSFRRTLSEEEARYGGGDQAVPLSEIPRVLLSECWNDMRTIAAQGAGFDPDWEQKVNR